MFFAFIIDCEPPRSILLEWYVQVPCCVVVPVVLLTVVLVLVFRKRPRQPPERRDDRETDH